jgi:hypothetical protein
MDENYITCPECKTIRNIDLSKVCMVCEDKKMHEESRIRRKCGKPKRIPINKVSKQKIDIELEEYCKKISYCIKKRERSNEMVQERVQAICNLKDNFHLSYAEIGRIMGYKDHTTPRYLYLKYSIKQELDKKKIEEYA